MAKKRKGGRPETLGSGRKSQLPPQDAMAAGQDDKDFNELWATLSHHAPTTKECESTVEGEPPFTVETTLPSFFDYYPALHRQISALASTSKKEAVVLMRACMDFLRTGDKSHLKSHLQNPTEMGVIIDLTDDADDHPAENPEPDEEPGRWQVSLGDEGWADFDDATNSACECARASNSKSFSTIGFQGYRYTIDVDRCIQRNESSGTVRPIRRTMGALFG
jgi:hypothetical protein